MDTGSETIAGAEAETEAETEVETVRLWLQRDWGCGSSQCRGWGLVRGTYPTLARDRVRESAEVHEKAGASLRAGAGAAVASGAW